MLIAPVCLPGSLLTREEVVRNKNFHGGRNCPNQPQERAQCGVPDIIPGGSPSLLLQTEEEIVRQAPCVCPPHHVDLALPAVRGNDGSMQHTYGPPSRRPCIVWPSRHTPARESLLPITSFTRRTRTFILPKNLVCQGEPSPDRSRASRQLGNDPYHSAEPRLERYLSAHLADSITVCLSACLLYASSVLPPHLPSSRGIHFGRPARDGKGA